jgi:hypothetical protein
MKKRDHSLANPVVGPPLEVDHWVYHSGFYDGPLSGMVELTDGRQLWAAVAEECGCPSPCAFYRRYQLYVLSPFAALQEAERHADFRRWVGTHADFYKVAGEWRRRIGSTHNQGLWQRYYDKWSWRDAHRRHEGMLVNAEPVGWFER